MLYISSLLAWPVTALLNQETRITVGGDCAVAIQQAPSSNPFLPAFANPTSRNVGTPTRSSLYIKFRHNTSIPSSVLFQNIRPSFIEYPAATKTIDRLEPAAGLPSLLHASPQPVATNMQSTTNDDWQPRKRARVACHLCHERKVRCDASIVGSPCTNCRLDDHICTLRNISVRSVIPSRNLPPLKNTLQLMSYYVGARKKEFKL